MNRYTRKPRKYHNEKVAVSGITFDSKKEADRYCELLLLQRAGRISELQRQVKSNCSLHSVGSRGRNAPLPISLTLFTRRTAGWWWRT